jgi:hypothetical protein
MMTAPQWIERYAEALGLEAPTDEQQRALLEIAATAAHASDRLAAPISCWVAAKSEFSLQQALDAATVLASEPSAEA